MRAARPTLRVRRGSARRVRHGLLAGLVCLIALPGAPAMASSGAVRAAHPTLPLRADRSASPVAVSTVSAGRLLVRFRRGVSAAQQKVALREVAAVTTARHPGFLEVDPADASSALSALRRQDEVAWAEQEVTYPRLSTAAQPERNEMAVPAAVELARSRSETFDGLGATVAVIDDGVSPTNPDLAGRVFAGSSACPGSPSTTPSGWHGTAVAALAAAADDAQGITGTAPRATVRSYKVFCDATGGALSSDIAMALQHVATDMAAAVATGGSPWVVNLSLGDRFQSRAVQDAIDRVHAAGGSVVAAAGNDGGEQPDFPAGGRHVLAVGATELRAGAWRVAPFSTRGSVTLLAPGADITTWVEGGGLGSVAGTSFSSPQVAGILAALIARGASGDAARALLTATAAPARDGARYPAANGTGRVDALAAYQTWVDRVPFSAAFPVAGSVLSAGGHPGEVDVLRYDPSPGAAPDAPADLTTSLGLAVATDPAVTAAGPDALGGVVFSRHGRVFATTVGPAGDGTLASGLPGDRFLPQPVHVVDASDSAFGQVARASQVISAPLSYGTRSQLMTRLVAQSKDRLTVTARLPGGAQLAGADPSAAVCVWEPAGPGEAALGTEVPDCIDSGSGRVVVDFVAPENGTYLFGVLIFDDRADGTHTLAASVTSPVTAHVVAPDISLPTLRADGYGYRYSVLAGRYPARVRGSDVQVAFRTRVGGRWVTSPWKPAGPRRATMGRSDLLPVAKPGGTYLLRARAVDALGRPGSWSPPARTDVPLDDRSPGLVWSPNTARVACPASMRLGSVSCVGGRASGNLTRRAGQTFTATLTTDTRRFGVIATTCSRCGWLTVYVDGRRLRTVSLRSAATRYRRVVFSTAELGETTRPHRLRLVARTTSARYRLAVDAIRLTR